MFSRRTAIMGAAATAILTALPARAAGKTHRVGMYASDPEGKGRSMFFSPRVLRVRAGDTVTFTPETGAHNCEATPGMIPDGAKSWRGQIGKPVSVTFDKPGYYGYHCMPHRSMGMVGLIIVEGAGRDGNLAAAKAVSQPGKAKGVWQEIWAEVAG